MTEKNIVTQERKRFENKQKKKEDNWFSRKKG
jgi:hypothetical protein